MQGTWLPLPLFPTGSCRKLHAWLPSCWLALPLLIRSVGSCWKLHARLSAHHRGQQPEQRGASGRRLQQERGCHAPCAIWALPAIYQGRCRFQDIC